MEAKRLNQARLDAETARASKAEERIAGPVFFFKGSDQSFPFIIHFLPFIFFVADSIVYLQLLFSINSFEPKNN